MANAIGGPESRARAGELAASVVGSGSIVGGCVPHSEGLLQARGHLDRVG